MHPPPDRGARSASAPGCAGRGGVSACEGLGSVGASGAPIDARDHLCRALLGVDTGEINEARSSCLRTPSLHHFRIPKTKPRPPWFLESVNPPARRAKYRHSAAMLA